MATARTTERRTWIDVTDFLRWRGAFTGFQRIQYKIAQQYIADGRNVAFFVYDEGARGFREVSFDPETVVNDGIIGVTQTSGDAVPPRRSVAAAVKRRTPKIVKRVAKKVLRPAGSPTEPMPAGTFSPFAKGDVVLVLGGIWHGSFATDISREKRKKHFTFVHIVHDMIPVVTPQYVVEDLPEVFGAYKQKIFAIADGLVINSQSSRKDAEQFMNQHGIKVPKRVVFRIADEKVSTKREPVKELAKQPFILAVGTIESRKNHALLYYVYKEAARRGIALPTLVIAGRVGWKTDDIRYQIVRDPDTKDKILLRNNVGDNELAWLFDNCLFTVWPSFYEGWGMPVAESLTAGKMCLSSDASSMPEIAPDLIEFFSPFSVDECLAAIQKYLDADVRKAKEQQIKSTYKTTSWRDMYVTISDFIDTL